MPRQPRRIGQPAEAKPMERPSRDPKPVSEELIAHAVERYLRRNPPQRGEPGPAAPPITDEQLVAAVGAYLQAHPPKAGKDGERGEPGKDAKTPPPQLIERGVFPNLRLVVVDEPGPQYVEWSPPLPSTDYVVLAEAALVEVEEGRRGSGGCQLTVDRPTLLAVISR